MKKILIIEDNEEIMGLLSQKISDVGYQVIEARDGEEGLRLLRSDQPDLVLLDIILPNIDGLELLKRKQALSETKDIPVVVISNSGAPAEISQARRLGAVDWITKTEFSLQETIDKIEKIIKEPR
ncbi:MAG TPA: response regulator [Candidatus Pacearchaeota archaeon]|jgi:CheY-like chemotaxis protein|nr:response regulator [Candidatus Pacearchaeota archaeon]